MARDVSFRLDRFLGLNCVSPGDVGHLPGESPDMLNFRVTSDGKLIKREGYESVFTSFDQLRGMWCGSLGDTPLFAAVFGDRLYVSGVSFEDLSPVEGSVPGSGKMQLFPFVGNLYLLTGAGIYCFDGETLTAITPYVPLLTTATAPNGKGTVVDEVNMLTPQVYQRFIPDGTSRNYYLAVRNIYSIDRIERGGTELSDTEWYWDSILRAVVFANAPSRGADDLLIYYSVIQEDPGLAQRILNCRHAMTFGGANDTRVFLYGSDEAPAMRYHSGMANGIPSMSFFPALGYTLVGDGSSITGILRHYDRQLIFTEKSAYYSTLEYTTETDGRTRAIFPVLPLSDDRGNLPVSQPLLVENEPCTLTYAGLFRWVSTNVRDERNAQCFSRGVNEILSSHDPKSALLFNRKSTGELYVVLGEEILVYQYEAGVFYRYQFTHAPLCCMAEWNNTTYFGTQNAIFRMGGDLDDGTPFSAYWTSSFLTLGASGREKNLFYSTLCGQAGSAPADCVFSLIMPDGSGSDPATVRFPAGGRAVHRRIRRRMDRFERVQVRLTGEGSGSLRVEYIDLKGKIIDKSV